MKDNEQTAAEDGCETRTCDKVGGQWKETEKCKTQSGPKANVKSQLSACSLELTMDLVHQNPQNVVHGSWMTPCSILQRTKRGDTVASQYHEKRITTFRARRCGT